MDQYAEADEKGDRTPDQGREVICFDGETASTTKEHPDRQYAIQKSIRKATWAAFWAAVLYAGVSAVLAGLTHQQLSLARDQFNLSERPWLGADLQLTEPANTASRNLSFDVHVQNHGRSSATKVKFGVDRRRFNMPGPEQWDNSSACSTADDDNAGQGTDVIFPGPGSDVVRPYVVDFTAPEDGRLQMVIVCVRYEWNNTRYHTRAAFFGNPSTTKTELPCPSAPKFPCKSLTGFALLRTDEWEQPE